MGKTGVLAGVQCLIQRVYPQMHFCQVMFRLSCMCESGLSIKKLYCRFYMHTELQQNAVIRMADDALFWTTSRYTRVPTSHIYRSDK